MVPMVRWNDLRSHDADRSWELSRRFALAPRRFKSRAIKLHARFRRHAGLPPSTLAHGKEDARRQPFAQ
jgi:hypothetical protein